MIGYYFIRILIMQIWVEKNNKLIIIIKSYKNVKNQIKDIRETRIIKR